MRLLLERDGVKPESKNTQDGRTPLSYAADFGHEAVVRLLLERDGVNPKPRGSDGRTPLSYAVAHGDKAVVRLLLERDGVNPESKNTQDGRTPLIYVCRMARARGGGAAAARA